MSTDDAYTIDHEMIDICDRLAENSWNAAVSYDAVGDRAMADLCRRGAATAEQHQTR